MYQNFTANTKESIRFTGGLLAVFIFFLLAVVFYSNYEGWSINDSVFFTIVTISTVGYGTPHPSDDNSRLFTLFFIIIGVFFVIAGVNEVLHSRLKLLRDYLCKSRKMQVAEDIEVGDIYRYRRQLWYLIIGIIACIFVGAIVMKFNEDWSWIEAFFFIIETSATVGYGDMVIKEASSKTFLCFYIILSTFLTATAIRTMTGVNIETKHVAKQEQKLQQLLALDFLSDDLHADRQKVSRYEVLVKVLVHSGVLDEKVDVTPLLKRIGGDGEGVNREDLQLFIRKERELALNRMQLLEEAKRESRPRLLLRSLMEGVTGNSRWRGRGGGRDFDTMELSTITTGGGGNAMRGPQGDRRGSDTESPLQQSVVDDDV
eukprot:gene30150-36421_t